jgi:transcriptional regulator with GAF, ATPase, and Fis domain
MSRDGGLGERSTIVRQAYDPSPAPEASFVLEVTSGVDRGLRSVLDGSSFSRILVGTSAVCDLRLRDPEVSRRHLALEIEGRELRIKDLGSKNGTYLSGVRVHDASARGGEQLMIGSTVIHVEGRAGARAAELSPATSFGRLHGASREMRRLYPLCEKLAAAKIPVVIEGETGTGKEVLAESLHEQSPRASGPFVVFDCTAVPPTLIESDLFGHERGAFTGALSARKGVFEQADGGTLLLDEIGDFPLPLQPKLLRALERSEIRRVGGDKWIHVDVRILVATRRDLDREVQAGRFRDDLYHRLAVGRIELPPLRERRGDLRLLVERFCAELGATGRDLPADVIDRGEEYAWPGNARELKHAVARALALGELSLGDWVAEEEPDASSQRHDVIEEVLGMRLPLIAARQRVIDDFEKRYVERLLAEHNGNVVRAAAASGIARRHFHRLKARTRG